MNELIFKAMRKMLNHLSAEQLEKIGFEADRKRGVCEKFKQAVNWEVQKYNTSDLQNNRANAKPYETIAWNENMVLDGGAKLLWELAMAKEGSTPFNNTNTYLYVGKSATAEVATQNGVQDEIGYAKVDATFPQVDNRTFVAQATFPDAVANDNWMEVALTNGNGSNKIALNRKVKDLGRKAAGTTWILKLTISNLVATD